MESSKAPVSTEEIALNNCDMSSVSNEEEDEESPNKEMLMVTNEETSSWLGTPLSHLPCTLFLPPIQVEKRREHVVMVEFPLAHPQPRPWPASHSLPVVQLCTHLDRWDDGHVRMPHSPQSLFPHDGKTLVQRWKLVHDALDSHIGHFQHLRTAILHYNRLKGGGAKLALLQRNLQLLQQDCNRPNATADEVFFNDLLPFIKNLCLRLPEELRQPLPLLRRGFEKSITLSQKQVACILANAFFCTFPRRNATRFDRRHEYFNFPSINFTSLYNGAESDDRSYEKLRCLLHYFRRLKEDRNECHNGLVTFERRALDDRDLPQWVKSERILCKLHIDSKGTIEDNGLNMLQVDFANAYVGGGVLGHGCVQEEIRFLISPELIASRLFAERMEDNECLFITGFERFSNYTGYARTFKWASNHVDETAFESSSNRRKTRLVAMDALCVSSNRRRQYSRDYIERELNKAYVAFLPHEHEMTTPEGKAVPVATGNWGCGAFGGDPKLKSLIQIMAASEAGRDVVYYTFGDESLCKRVNEMHSRLVRNEISVGVLFGLIGGFYQLLTTKNKNIANKESSDGELDLFDYLHKQVDKFEAETEDEGQYDKSEMPNSIHPKPKVARTERGTKAWSTAKKETDQLWESQDDEELLRIYEQGCCMNSVKVNGEDADLVKRDSPVSNSYTNEAMSSKDFQEDNFEHHHSSKSEHTQVMKGCNAQTSAEDPEKPEVQVKDRTSEESNKRLSEGQKAVEKACKLNLDALSSSSDNISNLNTKKAETSSSHCNTQKKVTDYFRID